MSKLQKINSQGVAADLTNEEKIDFVGGLGLSQVVTIDPVTGAATLSQFVISESAADDADGKPIGTIHLQIV